MGKMAVKQQMRYLETSMNLVAGCCLMVQIILFCLASPLHARTLYASASRLIPWHEIESLLSKRSFVSQEELFQLLHQLYLQQQGMIHMDKSLVQKLAGTIKSLFPLDACESITLQDGTVSIFFNKPQDIYIPNSWHQASLKISKHLVLRLEISKETDSSSSSLFNPVENNTQSVRFMIEKGHLLLNFSFLLKIFGNNLRNGQGSELLYQINEEKQISSLALIESNPITQHDLSVKKPQSNIHPDEYFWIDIRHADFPDTTDIGISMNKISMLGMDIELLPGERIRFGDEEPRQDKKAYRYFRSSLERFKDIVFSDGKPITIDYTRTFGYQFEERKMFISIGFRLG